MFIGMKAAASPLIPVARYSLIHGDRGRITAAQVEDAINPVDDHKSHTALVSLENTANRGGGSCYDFDEILAITEGV